MNAPLRQYASVDRAFTLIELLAVLMIISILLLSGIPGIVRAIQRTREYRARIEATRMAEAIKNFTIEHSYLPLIELDTDTSYDELPDVYSYNDENKYSQLCRILADGYMSSGAVQWKGGEMVDPWGSPYRVNVDANFDLDLHFREETTDPNELQDYLDLGVVVWSFGQNQTNNEGLHRRWSELFRFRSSDTNAAPSPVNDSDDIAVGRNFFASGRGVKYEIIRNPKPYGYDGNTPVVSYTLNIWTRDLKTNNAYWSDPDFMFYTEVLE